ncbi:MAG: acyl carrier protein [Polaribacter sp.]
MEQQIIDILSEARPEFDFKTESNKFIEKGMLDSFDIIVIISELEEKFDIVIDGDQILPENLDSIDAISNLVNRFSLKD